MGRIAPLPCPQKKFSSAITKHFWLFATTNHTSGSVSGLKIFGKAGVSPPSNRFPNVYTSLTTKISSTKFAPYKFYCYSLRQCENVWNRIVTPPILHITVMLKTIKNAIRHIKIFCKNATERLYRSQSQFRQLFPKLHTIKRKCVTSNKNHVYHTCHITYF